MNIILSFLIGIFIIYLGISAFMYLMEEEMHSLPKFFRPGAWIVAVALCIFVGAIIIFAAYLIGSEILNGLI